MSCELCVHWRKNGEFPLKLGGLERKDGPAPAYGICTFPVPAWVGYAHTIESDGENCATYKPRESPDE